MADEIYQNLKNRIDYECKDIAVFCDVKDSARRREILNNLLDTLIREIDLDILREKISKERGEMFKERLTNYTIKRHKR